MARNAWRDVVGYQCDEFPAFYSRKQRSAVDAAQTRRLKSSRIFRAQRDLGIDRRCW
jgi:pseudouridine-5'-phosphate glycosidase